MNYLLILIACLSCSSALVHYVKLEKGAAGCKTAKGKELKVAEYDQDEEVCGIVHCQTLEGDALILYCQRPAPWAQCGRTLDKLGVLTTMDFPQCCWTCVTYVICPEPPNPPNAQGGGN